MGSDWINWFQFLISSQWQGPLLVRVLATYVPSNYSFLCFCYFLDKLISTRSLSSCPLNLSAEFAPHWRTNGTSRPFGELLIVLWSAATCQSSLVLGIVYGGHFDLGSWLPSRLTPQVNQKNEKVIPKLLDTMAWRKLVRRYPRRQEWALICECPDFQFLSGPRFERSSHGTIWLQWWLALGSHKVLIVQVDEN